jgi:Domain of unknown function (DUF1992)
MRERSKRLFQNRPCGTANHQGCTMPKPELVEDEISRKLAEAEQTGELKAAPSYGKPLAQNIGWDDTPDEFKMAFKMLKDSGFIPPEIAAFHERAALRKQMNECSNAEEKKRIAVALSQLEQKISLRLESMRMSGSI